MTRIEKSTEITPIEKGWAIKHGLIGGFIAAIPFILAEIIAAAVDMGKPFMPLHMIASIPLQQMPTKIDPTTAIVIGLLSHVAYSMLVGVIVALIVASVGALRQSPVVTVLFATLIGFLIWPLNFYVIAPSINAP
jgi:hypothetical protein